MTSAIQTTTIDATFPTPGRDNDSQGFRTNFTGIKTGLNVAKNEISGLQNRISEINTFTNTTDSSSTNTGALQVVGGVGVGGDLWVGGEIHGTGLGVPPGTIVMWYGSIATIPSGWGFCDGTVYNDGQTPSPDLRNQFIIGASADNEGASKADPVTGGVFVKSGGNKDGTLGEHTHSYSGVNQSASGGTQLGTGTSGWYAHSSLTTSQEGSVLTGANLPPFYSLAYIIKLL